MARQPSEAAAGEQRVVSVGSCGCIAQMLIVGAMVTAIVVLSVLLVAGNPDRWQGIADPSAHPLALANDPRDPQTIYLGTEQGHILISHDGGQRWSEHHQGLPPATPISSLAVLPDGAGLLVGTSAGAYLSANGGTTWRGAGTGIPPHTIVDAVSALPDGTLLAGTTSTGVYESRTGGTTWVPATAGLPLHSDIYAFLALPEKGHVLAGLISGGVYASQDDGLTWAESDQGLGVEVGVNVFSLLAVPRRGSAVPSILAGTSNGVYVSGDDGATWHSSSVGIGTTRVISLARDPQTPTNLFAGTDTGVYQSRDAGATWRPVGFGLPAEQHVGAVGVIHPRGGEQVLLASVDRLYRYPGEWLLAPRPWRALGFGTVGVLVLALLSLIVWHLRALEREQTE